MSNSDTTSKTNSGGKQTLLTGIPPIVAGNPLRASSFALDQSHLDEIFTEGAAQASVVPCRRPPKGHFFTCRRETGPTWQHRRLMYFLTIEGHDPYVVSEELAKEKIETGQEDTIRPVLLVRYVTMMGEEALWPLKIDRSEKVNAWNASARNILKIAEDEKWVRIKSLQGQYLYQVSRKTWIDVPPRFSELTMDQLIDGAFAEERMAVRDHEIWDKLRDGSTR